MAFKKVAAKPKKIADKPMDAVQQGMFLLVLNALRKDYCRGDDIEKFLGTLSEEEGFYMEKATGPGLVCFTLQKGGVYGSIVVSTVGSKRLLVSAHGNDKHEILCERHFKVPVRK